MLIHKSSTLPAAGVTVLLIMTSPMSGCGDNQRQAASLDKPGGTTLQETASHPLLKKWCSDCHAPPNPASHTVAEWAGVVARMQQHRTKRGFAKIDDSDLESLINYLQTHAHS